MAAQQGTPADRLWRPPSSDAEVSSASGQLTPIVAAVADRAFLLMHNMGRMSWGYPMPAPG